MRIVVNGVEVIMNVMVLRMELIMLILMLILIVTTVRMCRRRD